MSVSDCWLRDGDGACTLASEIQFAFCVVSLASHGSKRGLRVESPMAGDELTCWAGTKNNFNFQ